MKSLENAESNLRTALKEVKTDEVKKLLKEALYRICKAQLDLEFLLEPAEMPASKVKVKESFYKRNPDFSKFFKNRQKVTSKKCEKVTTMLRKIRLEKGLSATQLAHRIGLQTNTLLYHEREGGYMKEIDRTRVATGLEVPIDVIFDKGNVLPYRDDKPVVILRKKKQDIITNCDTMEPLST